MYKWGGGVGPHHQEKDLENRYYRVEIHVRSPFFKVSSFNKIRSITGAREG